MPRRLRPTHLADVRRYVDQNNDNAIGEPEQALELQISASAVQFRPQRTDFVHEATGERVSQPFRAVFQGDRDVQEGDVVNVNGVGDFDVVGVDDTIDARSEATLTTIAILEAQ